MRWFGWGLFVAILAVSSWYLVNLTNTFISDTQVDTTNPYPDVDSARRNAYLLEKSEWLSFDLEANSDRLRINTTAAVNDTLPEEADIRYSIEYKVTDSKGNELSSGLHWLKTKASSQVEVPDGQIIPRYFFSEKKYKAGIIQPLYLRTEDWPAARQLFIRFSESESALLGVAVTVAQRLPKSKGEISILWRRMGEAKRQQIAAQHHIYPHFLLTESEIEAILSHDWKQVGPSGVDKLDFRSIGLFTVGEHSPSIKLISQNKAGLFVDAGRNLTVPIHKDGLVTLEFKEEDGNAIDASVLVRWHPYEAGIPEDYHLSLQDGQNVWSANLKAGLLEIVSTTYLNITPLVTPDEETTAHPKHYRRPILLTPELPLSYSINHLSNQLTPIRVALRSMQIDNFGHSIPDSRVDATWQSGDQISTSIHYPDYAPSLYDRQMLQESSGWVSKPQMYYFINSRDVDSVTFTSNSPVLIQVSTRLEKLPLTRSIPIHQRGWFDPKNYQNLWYPVRPTEYRQRLYGGATLPIHSQHKPVISDSDDFTDLSVVTQYHPIEESALALRIMSPLSDESKLTQISSFRRYRKLTNDSKIVELESDSEISSISPAIIFRKGAESPFQVQVNIDGTTILNRWVMGASGKLSLPSLSPGRKQITINSVSGDWYINHVDVGTPSLVEYQCYLLGKDQPLSFMVQKDFPQLLVNLQLFVAMSENRRSVIELELHHTLPVGEFSAYSVPIRRWQIDPPHYGQAAGFALNKEAMEVNSGTRFVYLLNEDLPQGQYLIKVRLLSGAPGFLRLTGQEKHPETEVNIYREELYGY